MKSQYMDVVRRAGRWTLLFILAMGLSTAPERAEAAGKYKKKGEVQVRAKKTKITTLRRSTKARREVRPQITAEEFKRAAAVTKVAKLTDAAISTLKRLIQVTENDDPEKPDLFFRLASHYREKKVAYMFRARELDEKIFQAGTSSHRDRLKTKQKNYEKLERKWLIASIKMYLRIANEPSYRKYKRMDEVLFNVADMLTKAKRQDKARKFFGMLIRNHPQSKYIPDAYLSFAEHYFNEGQVEDALKLYQQVGKYPNSPIYGYAVYKQGWCWLNLRDARRALEKFVLVIKQSGKWAGTKKSKIILVKEAKKDSVRAFANVPGAAPQKAWSFFQRIGGKFAPTMLEMLANLYYDQGKFLDSVVVFRKLLALNPKSKKVCSWQFNILRGTLSGKNKQTQILESQRLAAIYHAVKDRKDIRKTSISECRQNAAGVLRELSTTWHREAQKTQNNDTYAKAKMLYAEYLKYFPNEKDAYEMTYYLAELMYKLEQWEDAATVYTKVVKMKPKGKYLTDAAYASVISWKNALNVTEETQDVARKGRKKKGKRRGKRAKKEDEVELVKPLPIDERKLKMMDAFDTYIKYVPNAPELVPIIYRKARIYYNHNHYDDAVKVFALIVTKHSSHNLAIYAGNLLLDSLNIMKKYNKLNRWVDKMMGIKVLATGDFLVQLRKLKRGAQWKEAEQLRKQAQYKMCGERFAAMANEYQEAERWAEMLYNSAMCFEAAKLIGLAISIRNTLIRVKPDHKLAQKAMFMIGANYHALAWYSRAAEFYEKFALKYPGESESAEALQNAIVFRLGAGKYDKAIENSHKFVRNYGPRRKFASRTAAVNFSMGQIFENRKEWGKVIKHYQNYLRKWGRHGGLDRRIQAHVKIGRLLWRQSCGIEAVNGACIKIKRVRSKRKIKKRKKKKKTIELRTQCGPETKTRVMVVERNRGKASKAQGHFKSALKLYTKAKGKKIKGASEEDQKRRMRDMNFAAGAARFYQAEKMYEAFLKVKFPKNLDFSEGTSAKSKKAKAKQKKKAEKSKKEFAKYLGDKGKKLSDTSQVYQDVIKLKVAHWAIAAAARIGQLYQNFADALYTAPVPKAEVPKGLTRKEDKEDFIMTFTDTYCDTLEDKASPLEGKAVQGLATCLGKSTELSWYNEWSSLCESELNQIKPAEYPIAAEIRAKPGYVSFRTDKADLITEVK